MHREKTVRSDRFGFLELGVGSIREAEPGNIPDHGIPPHNCFSSSRLCRISSRTRFCSALLSEEYRPCFQRDRLDLARTLLGTRAGASAAVHPTSAVTHSWRLTGRATTGLGSAPWSSVRVPWRIPVFQPPSSRRAHRLIRLCLLHRAWKSFYDRYGSRVQRSPDRRH